MPKTYVEISLLDEEFYDFIMDELIRDDSGAHYRWNTYRRVLSELSSCGYNNEISEIKYRITDHEDPLEVIITVLEHIKLTPLLRSLYDTILSFRFYDF